MFDSRGFRLAIAAVALLLPGLGAVADAGGGGTGGNCDNLCRMQFSIQQISDGLYRTYDRDTCLQCKGANFLCMPDSTKDFNTGVSCNVTGSLVVTEYDLGTPDCVPALNTVYVQAHGTSSYLDSWGGSRGTCP
jgi:hypothetical protein